MLCSRKSNIELILLVMHSQKSSFEFYTNDAYLCKREKGGLARSRRLGSCSKLTINLLTPSQ